MSAVLDRLIARNPLLAHGVRTHSTGIGLATDTTAPASARRRTRRPEVDAPRVHLGPDHRLAR